jgi:hypothetical protein
MKVINFYKKGAHVTVEAPSTNMTTSFSSKKNGGTQSIGYTPTGNAKPVSGSAYDVIEYQGTKYLLLKKGYMYDVSIARDGVVREDIIKAEYDHAILQLPNNTSSVNANAIGE